MHRLQRAFLASSATLCTKGLPPGCTNSTKARSISVKTCKRNGTDGGQGLSVSGLIMPSQFRFAANPLGEDTMSAYVSMRTHGNNVFLYARDINRDGTYMIRATFQKCTTLT